MGENENKKMTKKEYFEILKGIVEESDAENKEELLDFITNQQILLENKAIKAKEAAAKRKAEGDELREAVKAVLTTEYQTIDEITAQVEGEEITKAKVVARLTQLLKTDEVVKGQTSTDDKKKVVCYKLAD